MYIQTHQIRCLRAQRSRRASSHHSHFEAIWLACPQSLAQAEHSRNLSIVFPGGRNSRLLHFCFACCHQSQVTRQCLPIAISWCWSEWTTSGMLFLPQRRLSSFSSSPMASYDLSCCSTTRRLLAHAWWRQWRSPGVWPIRRWIPRCFFLFLSFISMYVTTHRLWWI